MVDKGTADERLTIIGRLAPDPTPELTVGEVYMQGALDALSLTVKSESLRKCIARDLWQEAQSKRFQIT